MKIISCKDSSCEIIETDEEEYNTYRRYSNDTWEVMMGESWEPVYDSEEIETAYKNYKSGGIGG